MPSGGLRSPSEAPTGYIRPAHRARLAPAGVGGAVESPTPFCSTAEASGASHNQNNHVNTSEEHFEEVYGGAPVPASSSGEHFIPSAEKSRVALEKLRRFTVNRARRHGGPLVLDAVLDYFNSFEACILYADESLSVDEALGAFEAETDTPIALAAQVLRTIEDSSGAASLAFLADEIINLYITVESASSPRTPSVGSPGVDVFMKGMSDALVKLHTTSLR